MAKQLCKGTRKDGSPCRGVALEKYDGLCLAHGAPPDQSHQWRSMGGKNSAAAVRRDRRMPEYLKEPIDMIQNKMRQLAEKDATPTALNALCRAGKTLLEFRRFANEEMEFIRAQEIQAAAAARLDVQTDLEVLEATDDVRAQRDRFRRESLVHQGFAEFIESFRRGAPPAVVLNTKGRVRFGFQHVEDRQAFLEGVDDELVAFVRGESGLPDLPKYAELLEDLQEGLEETLSGLEQVAEAPFDPMTGEPFTRLPDSVKIINPRDDFCPTHKNPQEALPEQLSYLKKLRRRVQEITESENEKRRQAERDREAANRAELKTDSQNRTEQETDPEDRAEPETASGNQAALKTDPENRIELETANGDRPELEIDPGNRTEPETGTGDRSELEVNPEHRTEPETANSNPAEPEANHQADIQSDSSW